MAGIFGVCHFDDRPIDPELIARMSATLAHGGRDGEALVIDGSTALGSRVLHEASASASRPQPVRSSSGTRLVFDGRLDNRDELIAALRDRCDVSPASPDAALAAASYDINGTQFVDHLLGDFAVAVFDSRRRRVVLARDAMGIRPLYYRRTQTSLFFGSAVKTLLAAPDCHAHPNNQLLAELLLRRSHRRPADGNTLFAGVCQVPAAHIVVFTAEAVRAERYWDFDCHRVTPEQSFGDYARTFRVLFERAVARRLRSAHPVAIAVSGGLDSSSIFCAAASAAASPLVGLTYTSDDGGASDESAFVRDVERASARTIRQVDAPMEGLLFQSTDMVRIVEAPMLNGQWFRGHRLMNAVTAAGARTLLTGHWGDQVLFDQAYLVDLLRAGAWRTINAHLREYLRWFPDARGHEFVTQFGSDVLEYFLPDWVRQTVRAGRRIGGALPPWDDWFCDAFRREARPDRFAHAPGATALASALYREVRSQYHHFCLEWNAKVAASYGFEIAFPFLDRDLVEFLISVPGTTLARNGVPKALLRESLDGVTPGTILRRRGKGDFTEAVNRSTRHDFTALLKMLGPRSLVVELGYVDADKLERGLSAAGAALEHSTTSVVSWRVTAVAALEIWLRQFVGQQKTGVEDTAWQKTSLASAR
jgi:asparagine synthase (glutamine-hydrolysing)